MPNFFYHLPERQKLELVAVSERTSLPIAEVLRRMTDYCTRADVIGDVFPVMSGQSILKRVVNG